MATGIPMRLNQPDETHLVKNKPYLFTQEGTNWFMQPIEGGTKKQICGVDRKKLGRRCIGKSMPNGRCIMHGGKTPTGAEHGAFKTGRYSKYLPDNLQVKYQASQNDSELLALYEEISLIDVRLASLVERLATKDHQKIWVGFRVKLKLIQKLFSDDSKKALTGKLIDELLQLVQMPIDDYSLWAEIGVQLETKRKLVESERLRLLQMKQYMTAQEATTLFARVSGIIKENVSSVDERRSIGRAFAALLTANDGAGLVGRTDDAIDGELA